MFIAIHELGGWSQLYEKTGDKMHLHLPADHKTLPWIHIFGAFLLNINYWCANQRIVQRSLAAKSLKDVQIGLIVGGLMKYFMAAVVIIPGIALFGILGESGLEDPDSGFPYLVNTYLPVGLRGLILCALFAFASTIPLNLIFKAIWPDMNYFVRPMWLILIAFTIIYLGSKGGFTKDKLTYEPATPSTHKAGIGLLLSLVAVHILFH